ncbi:MAG TPA: hypothetical protein VKR79_00605 [Gaiellaceae bacterium]|nr:hypothetical protein [Gaiellaceae bacterium]
MKRVAVIGGSCTGKTTTSRRLAAILGVPVIELDALHHDPGWQEASAEVFRERVKAAFAAAPDGWVADGNYHGKLGTMVFEHADTVLWLDLPHRTALRRALWRTTWRAATRRELWNGNCETFRNMFSRNSIIWWVIKHHRSHRKKWPVRLAPLTHLDVVRLGSPRAVRNWLQSIQATEPMSGSSKGSELQKTPPFVET